MTHFCPQALQLFGSLSVLASQPLATLPSQLPNGDWQLETPQTPAWQTAVPLGWSLQTLPQVLQLLTLIFRFASQPLATLASQSPKPGVQVMPHVPVLQVAVPFVLLQAVVQAPQCAAVVCRLVSHPSEATPLQSAVFG